MPQWSRESGIRYKEGVLPGDGGVGIWAQLVDVNLRPFL